MQESPMIDKLFRRALEHAEATPPADLFDRVMEARAARHRRRALVWWRRPALLALVLVGGAAASLVWFRPWGAEDLMVEVPTTSSVTTTTPTNINVAETSSSPAPPKVDTTVGVATSAPNSKALPATPSLDEGPKNSSASMAAAGPRVGPTASSNSSRPHFAPNASPASATSPADGPTQPIGPAREPHMLLTIRNVPATGPSVPAPHAASLVVPYVLPKSDWWIGVRTTALNEQVTWQGDQERLVNALNAAEPATTNWALGLLGGRTWRSGLQVGAGLMYERSERAFSAIERQVTVDQEMNTYYVTLNSEIFVSQVDTITTISTSEQRLTASQEHALLRIPIEVGWAFDLWRFQLIPKVGFALDLHVQRKGTVLDLAGLDGRLVASRPAETVLRERQPDLLLAMAGFDLAYSLNERWSLNLGPQLMWTAAVLTRSTDQPQGLPRRAGLGFGLTYLLPGNRP